MATEYISPQTAHKIDELLVRTRSQDTLAAAVQQLVSGKPARHGVGQAGPGNRSATRATVVGLTSAVGAYYLKGWGAVGGALIGNLAYDWLQGLGQLE